MSGAYYNEFDKGAAAWLRELIRMGAIADGDVDERSIEDVHPSDLRGYTQCHFFSGIGGWSYALRLAGWPDDRPVWTGSCPCQPFSAAGQGLAFADERHLWPAFFHLIEHHQRPEAERPTDQRGGCCCSSDQLADMHGNGCNQTGERIAATGRDGAIGNCATCGMDDAYAGRSPGGYGSTTGENIGERVSASAGSGCLVDDPLGLGCGARRNDDRPSPTNGHWRDADWLYCRDGKWRPVEPGTFPLVDGLPRGVVPSSRIGMEIDANKTAEARVMRLRGYGNAINPVQAALFVEVFMESVSCQK